MPAKARARCVESLLITLAVTLFCLVGCQRQAAGRPDSLESPGVVGVTIGEVQRWIDEGENVVFLDSRSERAWLGGTTQIPGSIRVPPDDVGAHLDEIPADARIVTYCT